MSKFPGLRSVVLAVAAVAAAGARGSSYTRSWEFTDGTPGAEYIRAVATDNSGNVYLAGRDMGAPIKHWIARVNANGTPSWVRHSGDGFPDVIAQGFVDSYGAALILGRLLVVGQTRTAAGAVQDMGFIASVDPANGTVQGVSFFPGQIGYGAGFRAIAGDPSDGTIAWVAGWTDTAVESQNGLLVKYNANNIPALPISSVSLDANNNKAFDTFYSICVTAGAIHLGGNQFWASTLPWWARYDKAMVFQQQAILPAPSGETDGTLVGLVMAAGRLYAAFVGATGAIWDTCIVRDLNPANGSLLTAQAPLIVNGPPLGVDTRFSCGLAASPVTGRIVVANFGMVWDLTPELAPQDTYVLPSNWQADAISFMTDGRFATAGWTNSGNLATAAVWAPSTPAGGSSSTVSVDAGTLKIAPNVLELANGGWVGFRVLGDPASPFEITIYDMAGRKAGTLTGTTDAVGSGLIKFYGGNKGRDPGWTEDPLAPGPYRAVAEGGSLDKKPKAFLIVVRRKS